MSRTATPVQCLVRSAVSRSTKCGTSLKEGAATERYYHAFSSAMNASHSARRSMLTRLATPKKHRSKRDSQSKFLLHNFVVATPKKLHETKPVSEWISHQCQPTPFVSSDCVLESSACIHCLPDG
jgi:hypothetical protein